MKRLSDYKDEEAIDLWLDLLEPIGRIFNDEEMKKAAKEDKLSTLQMAQMALRNHKAEVVEVLTRIDDTPVDGLNILTRLIGLFSEISESEYGKSFFGFAEQAKKE